MIKIIDEDSEIKIGNSQLVEVLVEPKGKWILRREKLVVSAAQARPSHAKDRKQ